MKNKKKFLWSLWFKSKKRLVDDYESLLSISFSPEKRTELMLLKKRAIINLIKIEVAKLPKQ